MKLPKFIRSLLAALAFGIPRFARGKDEAGAREAAPIESQRVKFAPGGTLAEINKYEGVTIAGGPGSQRIGDAFDALPKEVRDRMILARKGIIRTARPGEFDGAESAAELGGTNRIAAGLARYREQQWPKKALAPGDRK